MPGEYRSFEPKQPEELEAELTRAEKTLGSEFFPNDEKRAEVLGMDVNVIKTKYPYRYGQYVKLIREAKGNGTPDEELISVRKYIALINNLEDYIQSYEQGKPEGFLREHQQDVFHKIAEFLNKGHKAGYLDLPTGFGKTVLFVELVKALSKGKEKQKNGLKTLVLVPTQDLVTQTIGKNDDSKKRQGFAKFAPDIKATAYYQDEKDLSGEVVVSTYQSFLNLQKENPKFTEQFDLVILDEAHKALGPVTKEQIQTIAPNALKIGCTATAEYDTYRQVKEILPELIHKMEAKEAVELGILANPRGFLYKTNIKIEGKVGGQPDYPSAVMRQLNMEARNKVTVDFVKTFVGKGIRGLVPCLPGERGQHARDMADRISTETIVDKKTRKRRRIIARSITEDTSRDERNEIYEAFKNQEIDCITYIDIITTGKDLPNAKFLVRNRPRKSKVESTQEIGRLLRPFEGEDPYIVEIEDEFPTGSKPYTIFDLFEIEKIEQGQQMVKSEEVIGPDVENIEPTIVQHEQGTPIVAPEVRQEPTEALSIKQEDLRPTVVLTPEQEQREAERMEREERYRELTRELLGKMKVEIQLVRELRRKELKEVNYSDSEQIKTLLSFSQPRIDNFAACELTNFIKTKFGGYASGFRIVTGQTILKHFGDGTQSNKNLNGLLKFVGFEYFDYNDSNSLKRILGVSEPKIDLATCTLNQFRETRFGTGGLIMGRSILLNFGSKSSSTENFNQLRRFMGLEVKELGQEPDYNNRKIMDKLLAYSTPKIDDFIDCTLTRFMDTKFGGGDSGLREVFGHTILKNFGDGSKSNDNYNAILKFIGLKTREFGRKAEYSKPKDVQGLLNTGNVSLKDLSAIGIQEFRKLRFGGGESGYAEISGQRILNNFGDGNANTENLKKLLKFIGV